MSPGLARAITIGGIVLSVGGVGLAVRFARSEMRVRGGFEASRVLITAVVGSLEFD